MPKILIADDDVEVLYTLERLLEREGYDVIKATSAVEVLARIETDVPDLFLIDIVLPGINGVELCRTLRADTNTQAVPIIFLTGQHSSHGVADALDAGGDDYVRKPFVMRELMARIRAHLRRPSDYLSDNLATIRISPDRNQVFVNGREVMLTRVEFDLLHYLCRDTEKMHSSFDLLANVWQYPQGSGDAALVRNHIRNLRRKLEINPDRPAIIQSHHGRGYSVRARVQIDESRLYRTV